MDWTDDGIVLSARKHGESAAVATLLTATHGRHAGLVRGGAGRTQRGVLQPGNLVRAHWSARLEEHLGSWKLELLGSPVAGVLDDALRLAVLSGACAVADAVLPEREAHSAVYAGLRALLENIERGDCCAAYVRWEITVLADLGYGLDLSSCAATGRPEGLAFVSPRTGRAVSQSAGEPYRDRLLPLPLFLSSAESAPSPSDIRQGMDLTAFFLERHVLAPHGRGLPPARQRLVERLTRFSESSLEAHSKAL